MAILRTPSGQPFYFNFHVSSSKGDDFDREYLTPAAVEALASPDDRKRMIMTVSYVASVTVSLFSDAERCRISPAAPASSRKIVRPCVEALPQSGRFV